MSRNRLATVGLTALAFVPCSVGGVWAQGIGPSMPGYPQMGPGMMNGNGQMAPGMMWSGGASGQAGQPAETTPAIDSADAPVGKRIVITVLPDTLPGPDGQRHDAVLPANYVLKANVPATLVVVNYDAMPHTITASALGVNIMIPAAQASEAADHHSVPTVTTFHFTPTHKGLARWYCMTPCDNWDMSSGFDGPSRDGYMAGYFDII